MPNHAEQLAQELNLSLKNVQGAIDLIDAGNTIPFIARYRKEATGSMDDQVLRNLGDRLEYLRGLDKRKEEVTGSIEAQNAMTPELQAALAGAKTLAEVEDIYRPYKPKRKTRASIARARGLQPLADATLKQDANFDPQTAANDYLNEEVPDAAAALAGAQDIIAETISDDAHCRAELRRYYHAFGMVKSVKAKDEDSVYTQYYDYTEPVAKIPGHRILALDRGEREGFLKVSIAVEAERAGGIVAWMFARKKTGGASAAIVEAAALDAYNRLIHPSLENELRAELTAKAAEGAITVFGENLRQLLHPFDLRNQLGIFFQNLWRCCLVQNGVNLRVNALDSGTDIAFYKSEAFDFSAGLEGNQRRKGQTDLIGIERADAVGKLLWQHRNHLVRIVDAGSSAVGFQIQRTALADIMADVCDVYAQIPVVLVALKRDCIVQILAVRRVDGEDVHTGQIHAVAQLGKRNTLLLNLSCLR